MALSAAELSIWDTDSHAFKVAEGTFTIKVGASSRDIRLSATMAVQARTAA